ncbi:hypothetical protein fugu_000005 [Takifugu bimaculatus]|uniref:C3H1-type domain-containing protein n=1 Tax=Takifugu bimaculatus TaxID=433685 RepID=A0A4Z2CFI0_9TELE|nr:hypothetical protein fugu_000005 [Takifugu bimaculatus]
MALNISSVRDTKWLTLEVCRQFQRGNCSRSNEECKFAHPPKSCQVENGRVIACFDSLKGRCSRENCKYLHPPSHLKTQLEINGRNNLIQQKTAAAVLAQQVQMMLPGHSLQPVGLGTNTGLCYGSYVTPLGHGMNLVQTDSLPSTQVLVPGSPPVAAQSSSSSSISTCSSSSSSSSQKLQRPDKLEVCREFQRGNCARGETDCRFAHPSDSPMIDTTDNTVTAFPHPVLPPLPKRLALDKSSWTSALLNPGLLQYHQALANAQLQQASAAFYPTGSVLCMTPTNSIDHPEVTTRNRNRFSLAAGNDSKQRLCKYTNPRATVSHKLQQAAC